MNSQYIQNIEYFLNLISTELFYLNKFEKEELEHSICIDIKNYILENIQNIKDKDFEKEIIENIINLYKETFTNLKIDPIFFKINIKSLIIKNLKKIYTNFIPPRSYNKSFIRKHKKDKIFIKNQINYLLNIIQPDQITNEWYEFRHKLITASSMWKIFKSNCSLNEIIYEKCQDYTKPISHYDSPMHWGNKYEPISILFYEKLYDTKVGDFGCIQHPNYEFIGASPDGINIKEDNERYGRMLEIKNIVNRKIDGIPKMEYWIQMQIQMETCNLNECDFLETQFKEYINYKEFIEDGSFYKDSNNKLKGIIIEFFYNDKSYYEYAPLYQTEEEYNIWEKNIFLKNGEKEWIKNIYWKLEKYSNILVLRNKLWFKSVIDKIQNTAEIIKIEKINGYEHRKVKKSNKNSQVIPKCLIQI